MKMKNIPYQAVLFDYDYTLADSSDGVIACFNFALTGLGIGPVAPELIRATIGMPLNEAFRSLLGPRPESQLERFLTLYNQQADMVMTDSTSILASVPETIERLVSLDIALGIVSTKERHRIEAVLKRDRLLEAFDVIVGGDEVAIPKPDPEGILTAIACLRVSTSRSLYVGDSLIDAETARRAGVPFVAVLTGETPSDDFGAYDVHGKISRLSELPGLME